MSAAASAPFAFTQEQVNRTITSRFEDVARAWPDRIALTGQGERWTYVALNRRANQVAAAIRAHVPDGPGCVAHLFDLSPEMVAATLGVLKAGKTCLPIHPDMPADAQGTVISDAAPQLLLTSNSLATPAQAPASGICPVLTVTEADRFDGVDNPGPLAQPADPALIVYTSGTTGRPKGVVWNHRGLVHRAAGSTSDDEVTPADRVSLLRHLAFAAGQTDMVVTLLHGATLSIFDITTLGLTALRQWIEQEHITIVRSPTLLFRRFLASLDDGRVLPSVRLVNLGGDTLFASDLELWKRHFVPPAVLCTRFSTSETGVLTNLRFDHDTVLANEDTATAGHPVEDVDLVVVDDEGCPVARGEEGDLVVYGEYLAGGYWRRPDDTARAFGSHPHDPRRRSYRTGDRGRLLPDGRFAFAGRRDRQVKIRGYRVDIGEVEQALRQLDEVAEAVVEPVKEADNQRLLAFVVLRAGAQSEPTGLRARLLEHLPEWKVPSRLFVVPAYPTTLTGKVDRQRLKDDALRQEAEQLAAASASANDRFDPLEAQVADAWRQILRCDRVEPDGDFFLLGGDSLQATILHLKIERIAGTLIPVESLFERPTIRAMAAVIRRTQRAGASRGALPILVPFRTAGTHTPLFLVHGQEGWSFARPQFLEILGPDQPVYGFQAAGLDRAEMPRNTIEEMASQYVRAMKEVQPSGPYFIGSACMGYLVAAEMASQLRRAGETVGPLMLMDPRPQVAMPAWRRFLRILRLRVQKLTGRSGWHQRRRHKLETRWAEELKKDPAGYDSAVRVRINASLDFAIARLKYLRWHYDGPVLILSSRKRFRKLGGHGRNTWRDQLTGDVRWFDAGGSHDDVIRASSELAVRQIRHCVEIVREELRRLRSLQVAK